MFNDNIELKNYISRSSFLNIEDLSNQNNISKNIFNNDDFFAVKNENKIESNEKIIRTSGSHNCGGRCVLKVHVKNKRVVRISTEVIFQTRLINLSYVVV